ncbi:hypothetical protein AVEN_157704-1 [Araneus ventricosus]|uniref:Uncharacterized protein n=1 Tax=Araneus ventricosus TaxID=182803 RepID=A0A4Y2FID4_ARAVE|nr:hypothetical protein AVEN_237487-1 [Araneus ventricosus]GBN94775.1 hypothetical protein AVEN_157704-1 [Araneus ventricosus]
MACFTFTERPLHAKWRDSTPYRSNFQSIHLGGSFTEAPCKRSLRSHRATAPTPPAFNTYPLPFDYPFPTRLHFVVFAFVRQLRRPFPGSHFSFMTQHSKWKTNEYKDTNFWTALTTGFGVVRYPN